MTTTENTRDDALIAWLADGVKVERTDEEIRARRTAEFVRRFIEAMNPLSDLGETEEAHQHAIAKRVRAVHDELNPFGEVEYGRVWSEMTASHRAALKHYINESRKK